MNRIFGRGKPKEAPPNMSDMIAKVLQKILFNMLESIVMS